MLKLLSLLLKAHASGSATQKIGVALLLGWNLGPVMLLLNQYVFDDWQYAVNLLTVIGIDTMLGLYIAYRDNDISSKGFRKLFSKLLVYGAVVIGAHATARHTVHGELNTLLSWIDAFVYSAVIATEFLSILENALYLRPMPWARVLAKRLRHFTETGEPIKAS